VLWVLLLSCCRLCKPLACSSSQTSGCYDY
jgi:hypothetical protein